MKTSKRDTAVTAYEAKGRWGQERRLAFIDLRLQYDGRINRSDLSNFFKISTQQASQDLASYTALAPQNLRYDGSSKSYVSTKEFSPHYGALDARAYLIELQALATQVLSAEQSFLGYRPPTGIVDTPSRALDADLVATVVEAIRDARSLEIVYVSMRTPEPTTRVVSPHALGYDGLRWHMRAYCHGRQVFRDFAIGRIRSSKASAVQPPARKSDTEWETIVEIVLKPHPKLTPCQREMVEDDYGMPRSGTLVVPTRQAMLFYTLRHLNLESDVVLDDPARQHVVVSNWTEIKAWLQDVSSI